ncbi:putative ribonuclease H-like domain-containing protein [Tanacetum coccineum]
MCGKKNSVLFIDTGCFVLSHDFKLVDESQVLLKVPRKNNMYSVDMKNIVPKECLTCLVAKATLDESMLWHRRLRHVNFKTINKLVKENLVRGLPTKRFENDQTCVALFKEATRVLLPVVADGSLFDYSLKNASNDEPQPSSDAEKKDDDGVNKESGIDDQERLENITTALLETTHANFFCDETEIVHVATLLQSYLVHSTPYSESNKIILMIFARIEAIRLFLAYASFKDFVVYQMDVKSAILYGKIEEEVYVCQIQGLKIRVPLTEFRVYMKLCTEFEKLMHKKFQMSSMGELTFFLGLQDTHKDDGIFISQDKPVIMFEILEGQLNLGLWYLKTHIRWKLLLTDSQIVVANSTTEAEYVAVASCCGQVLWIQNQMLDYGYNFMNTKIFIDNESTICIVKNLVFHSKTKHIEIRHHFIIDSNEKKLIQMIKIHTNQNVADLLTKAFDVGRFQYLIARTAANDEIQVSVVGLTFYWQNTVMGGSADTSPSRWEMEIRSTEHELTLMEPIIDEVVNEENIPIHSNDPLISGEDILKLNELMELCTNLSQRVLDLENTKTSQAVEIAKLKERVKKLERRNKSRTSWLKRLKKGRKIADLDADAEVVSTAEVTTASATTTTVDELTMAQTLIKIKAAKPKAVTTAATTTTNAVTRPKARGVGV